MRRPYFITYFCGFPRTENDEARYQEAIDCGFNLLQIEHGTTEQKKEALRFCEKKGVRACVHDQRITDLVYNDWERRLDDPAALDAAIREVCEDYRDYPALYSYNVIDEPEAAKFPLLGKIAALFKKHDPAHICYIDLFPNYATPEQLGTKDYDEYLRLYLETVKPELISWDHYHFKRAETSEGNAAILDPEAAAARAAGQTRIDSPHFFDNLEAVRRFGFAYGVPYMQIVLLTEHGSFRYLTRGEIRFEACQTLAYGCATLSYFRYWSGPLDPRDTFWRDQNSCIQSSGDDFVRCQHYCDVQAVNGEIRPIGERIAQTKSEAVFHVGEETDGVRPFAGYGAVRAIRGGRYTVGFFEDGTFLVANKDYLAPSECELEADGALERFDAAAGGFVPAERKILLPEGGCAYLRLV